MTINEFKKDLERLPLKDKATALAILFASEQIGAVALRLLGTNDAATNMGAIEVLAMEVKHVAEAIHAVADSEG